MVLFYDVLLMFYIRVKLDKIIVCPLIYNDAEGNKGGVNLRRPFHHASDHQKETDETDPSCPYRASRGIL